MGFVQIVENWGSKEWATILLGGCLGGGFT